MVKWKTHWENSRALESFRENEKIDEEQKNGMSVNLVDKWSNSPDLDNTRNV